MKSWTEGLTSRERVRKIALSLTRPRSVNWIKNEADVASWDTTKNELDRLVEVDQLRRVEEEHGAQTQYRYSPNYRRRYLDRVEELTTEHSKEELRRELAVIQDQIETWQATYEVESLDDLEDTLTADERSSDDILERNGVLRQWERANSTKRLIDHALSLYDDLERVDGTASNPQPGTATQS